MFPHLFVRDLGLTKTNGEIPPEYETVFEECNSTIGNLYDHFLNFNPTVYTLNAGSKICLYGNVMLAGNADFVVNTKFPIQNGTDWIFNDNVTTQTNPLLVTGNVPKDDQNPAVFTHLPISMIKCTNETAECKVQAAGILMPFDSDLNNTGSIRTAVRRTRISTKSSGSKALYYYTKEEDKKNVTFFDNLMVYSNSNLTFHYKKADENLSTESYPYNITGVEGEINGSFLQLNVYSETLNSSQLNLTWSPEASANSEWFFPEVEFTPSLKQGVYTAENVDTPFPINPGPDPEPEPTPEPTTSTETVVITTTETSAVPTEENTTETTVITTTETSAVPTEENTTETGTEITIITTTEGNTTETAETPTETTVITITETSAVPTEENTTETNTEVPTETTTEVPTEEPTGTTTEAPTEEPTETTTDVPTEEPTPAPTDKPTDTTTVEPDPAQKKGWVVPVAASASAIVVLAIVIGVVVYIYVVRKRNDELTNSVANEALLNAI